MTALLAFLALPLAPAPAQSLPHRLDARLDAPPYDRHLWGVALVNEKGALVYGRNPRQLFIPASNTKIVVAAVASALLPPDWTVKTSLYANGPVAGGVLQGDLILYGRGDPTFGKRCFATDTLREGACETDSFTRLRQLAEATPEARRARDPRRPGGRRELVRAPDRPSGMGDLRRQLVVRGARHRARLQRQQRRLRLGPRHRRPARRR